MILTDIPVNIEPVWQPHPGPQTDFCSRWEFEVFYGGAAGGGKTDCAIAEALRYVHHGGYNALIIRRTFGELEEVIDRAYEIYPYHDGDYRAGEHRWHFPSGAKIKFGHMQHEDDKYQYRGKAYQYFAPDEATRLTPTQYLYVFSRVRSKFPEIPCRVRALSNPGGPSHQFFKDRFKIGSLTPRSTIIDPASGLSRVFVPAKLKDNPSLALNDPDYVRRLMLLPEIERMRLMDGMWDAFEGQAIPELNQDIHGIEPFAIPPEWPRYRSFDWGYSTPFSVGWWAIDFDGVPYRYRELYGSKGNVDNYNEGKRMSPTEIAREIKVLEAEERENGIKIRPGPADPDIWNPRWKTMGGKKTFGIVGDSIATDMANEGINWLRADNNHILGRQQVHKRLELNDRGQAQVHIFNTCTDFWRTLPLLREMERNPEEIENKRVEDHIYDEVRYFFMFKPLIPTVQTIPDYNSFQHARRKHIAAKRLANRTGMNLTQAYGRVR